MATLYKCVNCGLPCREGALDPEGQRVVDALMAKMRAVEAAARLAGLDRPAVSARRLRMKWVHQDGKLMCPNNSGCGAFPGELGTRVTVGDQP